MNFFADLPNQAKALIGALLVIAFIAIGLNFLPRGAKPGDGAASVAPGQTVLFTKMDPNVAGKAGAVLKEAAIPFNIIDGGTTLTVPADKADDARIKLAMREDMSIDAEAPGFSKLFGDKPGGPISTDFEKKLSYNRALNGELARLIKKIDGIESAAVIINTPEDQLFSEEKKPTTAAVMVKQAPNRMLSKQQVEGVQNLVASSVQGLKTNNVTVVGDNGRLLSDGMADNAGNLADRETSKALDRQLTLTRGREEAIEGKVQSLLDKIFGPGRSVVRVAVDLDFSQRKTRTRLFAPPTDKTGAISPTYHEKTTENNGTTGASSGGVPGTKSNVPAVPVYGGTEVVGAGGQSSRTTERTQNNQMSYNDTIAEDEVGQVKHLSITALIQGLPSERVQAMTAIVSAAAGAHIQDRGDQVVVQPVAFDSSQEDMLKKLLDQQNPATAKDASAKNKPGDKGGIPLAWIIGTGAAFLILFVLIAIMRLANRKEDTTEVLVNSLGDPGLPQNFDPNALGGAYGNNPYEMQGTVPQGFGQNQAYDDGPFGFLEQMDPMQVAELLSQERPGTAAGILGLLTPGYQEAVLSALPPEMQEDWINRLQTQQPLPAFQQRTLAQQFKRRLGVPA